MPPEIDAGYAIVVQPQGARWQWALMNLNAEIAASGAADDRDSAWRCGAVAACAFGALDRARSRRV
ncbi:MAG: hypothetical protein ACOY4K_16600 [Pseudomonadota bacterium]